MADYLVPNLLNACRIMKLLINSVEGMSAVDIEKELGIPRTTLFRILKTLCHEEFVQKQGRCYKVGTSLVKLGVKEVTENRLRSSSMAILNELAIKTGYTAQLAVPNQYCAVIMEVCESPSSLKASYAAGVELPLHSTSVGKVFLAHKFHGRIEEVNKAVGFKKNTDKSLTTLRDLNEESLRVVSRGYAVENREFCNNVRGLAVPIYNSHGEVVAAMGILAPATVFTIAQTPRVSSQVKEAAREFYYAAGLSSASELKL